MTPRMRKCSACLAPQFRQTSRLTHTSSYEEYEPQFEEEEEGAPVSPHDPDSPSGATSNAQTPAPGTQDPDGRFHAIDGDQTLRAANGDSRTIVEVNGGGDGSQTQGRKNAVVGLKEKRISKEKRSTTPYMTKYERARVLGTRALQIRYILKLVSTCKSAQEGAISNILN